MGWLPRGTLATLNWTIKVVKIKRENVSLLSILSLAEGNVVSHSWSKCRAGWREADGAVLLNLHVLLNLRTHTHTLVSNWVNIILYYTLDRVEGCQYLQNDRWTTIRPDKKANVCKNVYMYFCLSLSASVSLFLFIPVCLSLYLSASLCLSTSLSIYLSVCLNISDRFSLGISHLFLFFCRSVSPSVSHSTYISVPDSVSFPFCLSLDLSLSLPTSICLSIFLSFFHPVSLPVCLSVSFSLI